MVIRSEGKGSKQGRGLTGFFPKRWCPMFRAEDNRHPVVHVADQRIGGSRYDGAGAQDLARR